METKDPVTDNRPEWLRSLTDKSWNLELIISGAAIFMANYLPTAVDRLLNYYLENWVLDENISNIALPLLAYSFMKVVAWVLIITFVVHFVLRAFWVGVLGLHAVYPDGIRYDKLPWQTEFAREQSRLRFGLLSDYILRLDRMANQVFSVAFLIALTSLGISLLYIFIFMVVHVTPVYAGPEAGKILATGLLGVFFCLSMLPAFVQLMMRFPAVSEKPWMQKLTQWTLRNAGFILLPLIYRPLTYLNLTYNSQIPKKRLLTWILIGFSVFMSVVLVNFATTVLQLSGRNTFLNRQFYAQGRNAQSLNGKAYDCWRAPGDRLPPLSIPSEVLEGPFLRVFVDYPKQLDAAISQGCQSPVWPDSLEKSVQRLKTDSVHLACLDGFFRLKINDSLLLHPGWMFQEHPTEGSPGLVAYLPAQMFKPGKNKLLMEVPSTSKPDSLRVYGELFFWYAPH